MRKAQNSGGEKYANCSNQESEVKTCPTDGRVDLAENTKSVFGFSRYRPATEMTEGSNGSEKAWQNVESLR
jgi:hypothetical protein